MAVKKSGKKAAIGASPVTTVGQALKEEIMAVRKPKKTAPVDIQKLVSEAAFPEKTSAPVKSKTVKTAAPVKAKTASSESKGSFVIIDYPTEGEVVSGLAYCMRLGASGEGNVEISINGGDWAPCRSSAGYWWFDWGYYMPGPHKITARIVNSNGKVIKTSAVRKCTVI